MTDFDYDFKFFQIGLGEIKDYILSEDLFWQLSINPPKNKPEYPLLTLGNLLLFQTKLMARQANGKLDKEQITTLSASNNGLLQIHKEWQAAWENKAIKEIAARLHQWKKYIVKIGGDDQGVRVNYRSEVKLRVILELLLDSLKSKHPDELGILLGLDDRLQSRLSPHDFIWQKELEAGFPDEKFWYLYGEI